MGGATRLLRRAGHQEGTSGEWLPVASGTKFGKSAGLLSRCIGRSDLKATAVIGGEGAG